MGMSAPIHVRPAGSFHRPSLFHNFMSVWKDGGICEFCEKGTFILWNFTFPSDSFYVSQMQRYSKFVFPVKKTKADTSASTQ